MPAYIYTENFKSKSVYLKELLEIHCRAWTIYIFKVFPHFSRMTLRSDKRPWR